MKPRGAIEVFNKWIDCKDAYQADPSCDGRCHSCEYHTSAEEEKEAMKMAVSALEKQEQDRWIPVTERLPEKDGNYLVTLYDSTERWTEVLYFNTTFGGRWQGLIEDDLSDIGNVSAWRPLPEPYTEEEEV